MSEIRVRFTRFWGGFPSNDNFLTQLIESAGFEVKVVDNKQEMCDIEFISVFASPKEQIFRAGSIIKHRLFGSFQDIEKKYNNLNLPKSTKAKRRIWLTGENLRPPYTHEFDGFLSFDQNLFNANAYLPIWYFDAGFYKSQFVSRVGVDTSIESLLNKRSLNTVPPKFACMFAGNPHSVRLQFAEILENVASVDKYGAAFGNSVSHKFPIGRQYKFNVAFENDIYPGYVTEKLLEAYLCESIPVYWGDLGASSPINTDAIMMKREDQTLNEFALELTNLTDEVILEKLNQPFLKFRPPTNEISRVILGHLNN